jgi:excisionase family DNA binding protein
MVDRKPKLGEILVECGLISPKDLERALTHQTEITDKNPADYEQETELGDYGSGLSDSNQRKANSMLSVSDVSRMLNIHINTVRRWSDEGIIKSCRINGRGDRRFDKDEIIALISKDCDFGQKKSIG